MGIVRDQQSGRGEGDLHVAFSAPDGARLDDRATFLRAVDRLPGFAEVRASMRRLAAPPEGGVLVDAGCGPGWETERLAAAFPAATVLGLDHDREALAAARARTSTIPNLRWQYGEFTALDLAPESVDVLRTERALIYVEDLAAAVGSIASVLRPGGVFASFELDYGATALPPRGRSSDWVRRLTRAFEDALPQPWAGRLLPEVCAAHGLEVTTFQPHSFMADHPVWSRIVADTLRAALDEGRLEAPGLEEWIAEFDRPDFPRFLGAFTGVLTVAARS